MHDLVQKTDEDESHEYISLGTKQRRAEQYVNVNIIIIVRDCHFLWKSVEKLSVQANSKHECTSWCRVFFWHIQMRNMPVHSNKCKKKFWGVSDVLIQSRTCSKCRGERAFVETCSLNGMDDFLKREFPTYWAQTERMAVWITARKECLSMCLDNLSKSTTKMSIKEQCYYHFFGRDLAWPLL